MRLKKIVVGAVALTALFGALAACSSDSKKPVALTVKASSNAGKFAFDVPKEIDGGVVALTLDNTDNQPHELGLVRVKDGTSPDQFATDVLSAQGAPIPDYVIDAGGVGFAGPTQKITATQKLAAGSYVYFCTFGDGDQVHYKNGMLGTVTVKGDKGKGNLPANTGSIAAKDYGFDLTGLKAGSNPVKFTNTGQQLHHAQLMPLADGATFDQAKAFLAADPATADQSAPPPVDFQNGVGVTVLAPGQEQVVDLNLKKGEYIVLCFLTDRAGGPPHFTKGMVADLKVE